MGDQIWEYGAMGVIVLTLPLSRNHHCVRAKSATALPLIVHQDRCAASCGSSGQSPHPGIMAEKGNLKRPLAIGANGTS